MNDREFRPRPLPAPGGGPGPERPGMTAYAPGVLTLDPRLLLADSDLKILYGKETEGKESSNINGLPIDTGNSDNTAAGYLGYCRLEQPSGQLDLVFAQQQKRSFAYAALAMIGLSTVLTAALSAHITGPVLRIRDTVSRIRNGQFDQHIIMKRRDEIGDLAQDINQLAATLDRNLNAHQRNWTLPS